MEGVLGQRQHRLGKVVVKVEDIADFAYNNYAETNEVDVEASWTMWGEEKG